MTKLEFYKAELERTESRAKSRVDDSPNETFSRAADYVDAGGGLLLWSEQGFSENLAAEKTTTEELRKQLTMAQMDRTTTEQNFNITVTMLRQTFPEVEKLYNLPAADQTKIVQSASKRTAGQQKKRRS